LKTGVPLAWEYLPVSTTARLGVQIEFVTKAWSKRIPPRASRSRCGVWFTLEPYTPIACWAWSSEKMNRMFGRAAAAARTIDAEKTRPATRARMTLMGKG
jgi:hypothetical protein